MKLHFIENNKKNDNNKISSYLLPIINKYNVTFNGCYLDQIAILPLRIADCMSGTKERKTFKLEERNKRLTESYSIQIVNEMKTRDILIRECFYKAKIWE